MILLTTEPFFDFKTLYIAFAGAIIGQLIVSLFSWCKIKKDLNQKRNLIISDLKNQGEILNRLNVKLVELKELFKKKETDRFTSSVFHDLHLDIFESVSKIELYEIFKNEIFDLVDVYNSIEFLKEYGPFWIYEDYLNKSNLHIEEKKNDLNHEFYCKTHLDIISFSITQIENNLNTIEHLKITIKKLTK